MLHPPLENVLPLLVKLNLRFLFLVNASFSIFCYILGKIRLLLALKTFFFFGLQYYFVFLPPPTPAIFSADSHGSDTIIL